MSVRIWIVWLVCLCLTGCSLVIGVSKDVVQSDDGGDVSDAGTDGDARD